MGKDLPLDMNAIAGLERARAAVGAKDLDEALALLVGVAVLEADGRLRPPVVLDRLRLALRARRMGSAEALGVLGSWRCGAAPAGSEGPTAEVCGATAIWSSCRACSSRIRGLVWLRRDHGHLGHTGNMVAWAA